MTDIGVARRATAGTVGARTDLDAASRAFGGGGGPEISEQAARARVAQAIASLTGERSLNPAIEYHVVDDWSQLRRIKPPIDPAIIRDIEQDDPAGTAVLQGSRSLALVSRERVRQAALGSGLSYAQEFEYAALQELTHAHFGRNGRFTLSLQDNELVGEAVASRSQPRAALLMVVGHMFGYGEAPPGYARFRGIAQQSIVETLRASGYKPPAGLEIEEAFGLALGEYKDLNPQMTIHGAYDRFTAQFARDNGLPPGLGKRIEQTYIARLQATARQLFGR